MNFDQVCASLWRLYSDGMKVAEVDNPDQFDHQRAVIARAWQSLIKHERSGIVLADEVGLGKTFEALGVMYFYLLHHLGHSLKPRVLIVLPPKLLDKWTDELENFASQIQVLEPFLPPKEGAVSEHIRRALPHAREITLFFGELILRPDNQPLRRDDNGFFLIRETKLTQLSGEREGAEPSIQRQFMRLTWDGVIIDEAHRYARGEGGQGSQRSRAVRALCDIQRKAGAKILLCTATPFQLDTGEMKTLLELIESQPDVLAEIQQAIEHYNQSVVDLRCALEEEADVELVTLRQAVEGAKTRLENCLRPYILRSRRPEREGREIRKYHLESTSPGEVFPWTYWRVKDWTRALVRDEAAPMRTFLPTTFHLTLSSPEALTEHLQRWEHKHGRKTGSAAEICREILDTTEGEAVHPKLEYLGDFISGRIKQAAQSFSGKVDDLADYKCVIFVSHPATIRALIERTSEVVKLTTQLASIIQANTDAILTEAGIAPALFHKALPSSIDQAITSLLATEQFAEPDQRNIWETPYEGQTRRSEFRHLQRVRLGVGEDLSQVLARDKGERSVGEELAANLRSNLAGPLNQYELALGLTESKLSADWQQVLASLAREAVEARAGKALKSVRKLYYGSDDRPDQPREWLRLRLSRLAYAFRPRHVIEGLSGNVDFPTRQQIINAFNNDLYPLILLCSTVAEEGIDLQKRCNTVVHYDLEWNPAKVEQREGRVDRLGRRSDEPVQIITLKLDGTYDERIWARCRNRRIWMELYLCTAWKQEGKSTEEETIDKHPLPSIIPKWLEDYRLDLRPAPI